MMMLGAHLFSCIALSLELPEDYFEEGLEQPQCGVRLLRYPPQPRDAAFNQLGAGAHTDWGSITLLLQDDNEGLEVQNAAGEWLRAQPIAGTFVINLGQLMQRLTNGLYHATMHRVMNNVGGRERYSVATFFDFDYFHRVECAPACLPASGRPDYEPCTVGEHIEAMFRQTYAG
jgi:isopenicillin N synthase-like dioxygenase